MASSSTSLEIENQLENGSIHSSDIPIAQEDKSTGELRSRKKRTIKLQVPESVKKELMPPRTAREFKQFILVHLPILSWVWSYQPKFLIGDIISGVTVSVMHIPQGMAYAALAELPPVYGLYTSFMAPMIYAVFGTSRHISVGIFAIVSLMVGDVVRRTIDANPSLCTSVSGGSNDNTTNTTDGTTTEVEVDYPDCPASVDIAITMAFVYAMFMILFGFLRLGFMATFLSEPLVSGYTTGAAVHVFTSQLRHIVGVPSSAIRVDPGVFALPRTWVKLIVEVVSGRLNWAAVVVSVICMIFLVLVRLVNAKLWKFRCYKKLPIPIPAQLIAVIVATLISTLVKLRERYDVDVVGELPTGLPPLTSPKPSHVGNVFTDAFVAVVVCYSVTLSLAKVFAKKHGYTIYPNQDFFAFGIMNAVGSFFSCFNSSASLSRSVIQEVTGGKTQAVAFVSSSILLIVLLVLGPLFEHLPRAILSSIIVVALLRLFMQGKDVKKYYQLSIPDMFIWIVVFLATVFLGVDLGLGVGIGFAMLLIVVRTVVPVSMSLGKEDDCSCSYSEDGNKIPGVLIFRFMAPLCFTNAQLFMSRLAAVCGVDPEKQNSSLNSQPGCIEVAYHKLSCSTQNKGNHKKEAPQLESQPTHNGNIQDNNLKINSSSNGKSLEDKVSDNQDQSHWCPDLQYIIVDMAPVTFIDSCGSKMLDRVRSDYSSCGIQLVLAATSRQNMESLEYSGFADSLGTQWFLPSIQAAVDFIEKQKSDHQSQTEDVVKCNSKLSYDETSL